MRKTNVLFWPALGPFVMCSGFLSADTIPTLIAGNNAAFGGGPIATYSFDSGALLNSFIPDGASSLNNGRGVAIADGLVYYTELPTSPLEPDEFGPSDGIHVAPFHEGAGGSDIGLLPNPNPDFGIQALAFSQGFLYALTGDGFPLDTVPVVYQLDAATGSVVRRVVITGPTNVANGFTVLPDGNFLINCDVHCSTYAEYNSASGLPAGPQFTLSGVGLSDGVDVFDGRLYFATDSENITKTDLMGNVLRTTDIGFNLFEDIAVIPTPEPGSGGVLGAGLLLIAARLGVFSRLRKVFWK